jgi:hypothetical protein
MLKIELRERSLLQVRVIKDGIGIYYQSSKLSMGCKQKSRSSAPLPGRLLKPFNLLSNGYRELFSGGKTTGRTMC